MTRREKSLATLTQLGYKVATSLPTRRENEQVRPAREIAARFLALRELFLWVASEKPLKRTSGIRGLTPQEKKIHALPRAKARALHQDTIGWRLENMWPLAWVLGFDPAPPVLGTMIDDDTIRALVRDFDAKPKRARDESDVLDLEDLFYCAHNAARSASLGGKTVPRGFPGIAGMGVIHERRHALTWATSHGAPEARASRVKWDDTDLST